MIDAELLDYDFDEEATGYPEPARVETPTLGPGEYLGGALLAAGLTGFLLQLLGAFAAGTWIGVLGSYGLIGAGSIAVFYFRSAGTPAGIRQDRTFFTGYQNRRLAGWIIAFVFTAFYVVLYFYEDLQRDWGMGPVLEPAIRMVDPLAYPLSGGAASHWFLYGVLYTFAVTVFGVRMLMKYRHSRHQQLRTLSVTFFQVVFAWLLSGLMYRYSGYYTELNGIWPLKYDYLWPGHVEYFWSSGSAVATFFVFWSLIMAVVATPLLTWRFGKRWYCSWVCGCGGLAETLGDPWRQRSDKSSRAWMIERVMIHGVLVFVLVTTALLWASSEFGWFRSQANDFRRWYVFLISATFSGVVGVGFYPLLGSRVWCRFGCPMAAILGIFQRAWSRFRITTNGEQCMSCGNCSTYCEMGIDVRAYAQKGENIVRAACVGCGICSAVCPRGVLNLENGLTHADRYDGAESPIRSIAESIKAGTAYPE